MLLEQITKAIFPDFCYGCGTTNTYLCYDCYHVIDLIPEPVCPHCEKRLPFGELPRECGNELALNRLFSCANYKNEALNRLIKDLKYGYAYKLAEPLAEFAAWWLQNESYTDVIKENADLIVPVPLYKKKLKKRGFNQSALIAEYLSPFLGIPAKNDLLIKTRETRSQVEADSKEKRRKNLKGAFTASSGLVSNKTVLLVDDVLTTGSTLRECAKTLHDAGAKEVWALTIAKD